ncbi:MAG: hypothetical protein KAW12_04240, partial [Candidatus Aminicenantes bacterium]|nr:hypothetical protein [Candidatus Aminicenantes bacterium]
MGNYSRDTFELNKLKNYVGVRLQQGVPLVDADWNEMDETRRQEIRSFLKNYVGNGIPGSGDDFKITEATTTVATTTVATDISDNFTITGGTAEAPGRCLIDGWEALIYESVDYKDQVLYDNPTLAGQWGVDPLQPLSTPETGRSDLVYLDVWEREVGYEEDNELVNPVIGIETCTRIKREWTVRVIEDAKTHPDPPQGHVFYDIAGIIRRSEEMAAAVGWLTISDLRYTGLNLEGKGGSMSSADNLVEIATSHNRQVNVSLSSTASGYRSQVNACDRSTASGTRSQVNASSYSTASAQESQVNASGNSTASAIESQVNASELSTASGQSSQVNASTGSEASGEKSQVNASELSTASG